MQDFVMNLLTKENILKTRDLNRCGSLHPLLIIFDLLKLYHEKPRLASIEDIIIIET